MLKRIFGFTGLIVFSSAGAFSQTTAALVDAGYSTPEPPQIAPGQVVTLYYRGIGPLPGGQPRSGQAEAPLPTLLAGLSAQIIQQGSLFDVPISQVAQQNTCDSGATGPACLLTAIQVQIPFEISADAIRNLASGAVTLAPRAQIDVYAETERIATGALQPVPDNAHVLTNCDLPGDAQAGTTCDRLVSHSDGRRLDAAAPAARGETIDVFLYGLGPTAPAATTGAAAQPGHAVTSVSGAPRVVASFTPFVNSIANAPRGGHAPEPDEVQAEMIAAVLESGKVGVYAVAVRVPASLSPPIECGGTVRSNYILTVITSQGAERIPVCISK